MKFVIIISSILFAGAVWADNSPTLVSVEAARAFIPVGFDDNDIVQVTVTGVFPSNCYKVGPATAVVDPATLTIQVAQSAYFYGGICLPILVPFSQTINVGIAQPGTYQVQDKVTHRFLGQLSIARSNNSGPDDYLYAPITDAYVSNVDKQPTLFLNATFTDRCTTMKEIRILYQQDVIVVQPIVDRVGSSRCGLEMARFQYTRPLAVGLQGTFLLHVRAMSGQAINKIVEIPEVDRP